MNCNSPRIVAALILGLTGCAVSCLAVSRVGSSAHKSSAAEFQQLVGGLGFGPAVDLSRCGFSFDPRLCPDCPLNHGPVPGGVYFCPQHACSILAYPPLTSDPDAPARGESDGRAP